MAGAGYKLFATGDVLTAAQVNTYLMQQTVMVFASSTARTTALSGVLAEGMVSYLQDTNATEVYDGSAWVAIGNSGDITGVTAGTGLSGGGASGSVTLSIDTATTVDKTTAQTLTNKTISATSNTLTGVINNTLTTTTGDLIYASSANTPARLAIGSTSQVLTVSGGVPTWATPASGGGFTLISTTVPSSSTGFSFSSISSSYKHLLITWNGIIHSNSSTAFDIRLNNDSGANYHSMVYYGANTSLTQANNGGATSISPNICSFGFRVNNTGFNNTCSGYMWIYDYTNTSYAKQCAAAYVFYDTGGATHTQCWNSQITYNSLSAISSIDIVRLSGTGSMNITTNGAVKLWGVS